MTALLHIVFVDVSILLKQKCDSICPLRDSMLSLLPIPGGEAIFIALFVGGYGVILCGIFLGTSGIHWDID